MATRTFSCYNFKLCYKKSPLPHPPRRAWIFAASHPYSVQYSTVQYSIVQYSTVQYEKEVVEENEEEEEDALT